jgi:uncharacterized repeat protein (TIGR04076 family)
MKKVMKEETGFKVIATIKRTNGICSWGHKEGDSFEISCWDTGGLCGMFYHYIFPELMMLQFGGGYPWQTPDKQNCIEMTCSDPAARVVLELKRISEK